MTIRITYLATVFASVLFLVIGHKIAVDGLFIFQDNSQENVKAKVQSITEREKSEIIDEFIPAGETVIFEARITGGAHKGEIVRASQSMGGFSLAAQREVGRGDTVLLIGFDGVWYFNGYERLSKLLVLGILFTVGVLFFGGKKGFNTILSLGLTCGAVFAVFIPAILSGKNIYLMSLLVCVYTVIMTRAICTSTFGRLFLRVLLSGRWARLWMWRCRFLLLCGRLKRKRVYQV